MKACTNVNPDVFIGIGIGAFISFVVTTVIAAPRFWTQHEWALEANATIRDQAETITDLESRMVPTEWDDPPTYEESRARHPSMLKPGTEIIRIDTLDDMPDVEGPLTYTKPELTPILKEKALEIERQMMSGWRGKVGDE